MPCAVRTNSPHSTYEIRAMILAMLAEKSNFTCVGRQGNWLAFGELYVNETGNVGKLSAGVVKK